MSLQAWPILQFSTRAFQGRRQPTLDLARWCTSSKVEFASLCFLKADNFLWSFWRIFDYTSQKQAHVCRNRDKVRVQMETWEYMCCNLSQKLPNLSFVACTSKNLRWNTSSGEWRSTQRKVYPTTKCVLLTEEELTAFAAIVGPTTLSGLQKMRSSAAVAYQDLLEND